MPFSHGAVYNPKGYSDGASLFPGEGCPTVIVAPGHYIQGANTIGSLGRYVSKLISNCDKVGIFITAGGLRRLGDKVKESLADASVGYDISTFSGVCSYEEADDAVAKWRTSGIKAVIGIGGGSCHDCAKLVAFKLQMPTVIVATVATTDAPCSAISVMYSPEGEFKNFEFYPQSPNIVLVDTQIIAEAGRRGLVSGCGDALSTYYEARTCLENPKALSMVEARPSTTSVAISSHCKDLIYKFGVEALKAVEAKTSSEALERVVEANTLLSGMGFESAGLAASHAVAQALSWIKSIHDNHQHGEMVAMGLLTMLTMEEMQGLPGRSEELEQVGRFLCEVGLPCCHEQIHFDASNSEDFENFLQSCLDQWICHNEPFTVTKELVRKAWQEVDVKGKQFCSRFRDEAYRLVHGKQNSLGGA